MNTHSILIYVTSLCCLSFALAYAPGPLQDFCVADLTSSVNVNGFACKDPKLAQASDFSFSGLDIVGNTSNKVGSIVTPVFVFEMPGLNTLGISMVRIDIAPQGINPPHWHPRASEILTVLEGVLEVGFVTSNPENRLITKVLYKGDVFAFPLGLTHFQRNIGKHNAVAIAALNSQNPGIDWAANELFKSNPQIPSDLLAKAFQTDTNTIDQIKRSV